MKSSKTCIECLEKSKKVQASKKDTEEDSDRQDAEIDDLADFFNMSAVNLDTFLDGLSASEADVKSITARVNISSL